MLENFLGFVSKNFFDDGCNNSNEGLHFFSKTGISCSSNFSTFVFILTFPTLKIAINSSLLYLINFFLSPLASPLDSSTIVDSSFCDSVSKVCPANGGKLSELILVLYSLSSFVFY